MSKTSAGFMLVKLANALESMERTRTELIGLQHSLRLLKAAQAKPQTPALTPEGWSTVVPTGGPPSGKQLGFGERHGCVWNARETADLRTGLIGGRTVVELASKHRRSVGAINSEIGRWFNAARGE